MSIKVTRRNTLYGYPNPQAGLQQEPLVMQRDPMVSDAAEVGTIWCNTESQSYWILTASQGGVNTWTSSTGGAETVTSLTVDPGDITVTDGDINVDTGNVTVAGNLSSASLSTSGITLNGNLFTNGLAQLNGPLLSTGPTIMNSDNGAAPSTMRLQSLSAIFGLPSPAIAGTTTVTSPFTIIEGSADAAECLSLRIRPTDFSAGPNSSILISNNIGQSVNSVRVESAAGGISLASGANISNAISIGVSGGSNSTVLIANNNGTNQGAIFINAISGGIVIVGLTTVILQAPLISINSSDIRVSPDQQSVASPTVIATSNVSMSVIIFTGFTTVAGSSEIFTINNSLVSENSGTYVSVSNTVSSGEDARMILDGVVNSTGALTITITNNGTANLNGNIIVSTWIISA